MGLIYVDKADSEPVEVCQPLPLSAGIKGVDHSVGILIKFQ